MKREVKIGIFAVAIICCSWAGIRFLSGIDIFGRNVSYYAHYDKINGINNASPVMIQGVKVGAVTDIILDPASSDKVIVKLSVKHRYQIPDNSEAKIYSPGLMSSMAIGLTLGDSSTFLENGDQITTSTEADLMEVATEKLLGLTDQIAQIGEQLSQTLTSVNTLLEGSSDDIDGTLENFNSITSELAELLAAQSSNMESAIEGLTAFSTTIGDNSESIDKLIANFSDVSEQLAEEQIVASLKTTITELNSTIAKINTTEGSAGMLLNDQELYQNLSSMSGSLNELIIDMQANPKRYVHFSLFGSKDKSE